MVTRWGMSDRLGMVQMAPPPNPYLGAGLASGKPFSEETARLHGRVRHFGHQEIVPRLGSGELV